MQLKIGSKTDVGLQRKANEDSMIFFENENYSVVVVCDGMGGHVGGKIASSLACQTIKSAFLQSNLKKTEEKIKFAVSKANEKIFST
ncbi:MAG: protein phosphatase 2C domain-containing protein, partial [Alphaproteobacteria bacterium]